MATGDISRGMKRRVALRIGDPDLTAITSNEIYAFLCEAALDILTRIPTAAASEQLKSKNWTSATTPPITTDTVYALPDDCLWVRSVIYSRSGDQIQLKPLDVRSSYGPKSVMLAGSSTSGYYQIRGGYVHLDVGTPVPSTDWFRVYYVAFPYGYKFTAEASDLSAETGAMSDSVDPVVSRAFWPAMEAYAVARCMECRGFYGYATQATNEYLQKLQVLTSRFLGTDPLWPKEQPKP